MLRAIQCVKVVYCPKVQDFVFLQDCEKCPHFGGSKRMLRHSYVDCMYFELEEVDSDE